MTVFHCTAVDHEPDFVESDDEYKAAEVFAENVFDRAKPFKSIDVQVQRADGEANVVRVCAGTNYSASGFYDCFAAISKTKVAPT